MSAEELQSLQNYLKENDVEELILGLVEATLREKPENPSEFIFDVLQKHDDDSAQESCPRSILGSISHSNTLMDVPSQYLMALFESTKKITGEIVPKDAINIIMTETIKLLDCDRCSLFVYDKKLNVLVLTASNMAKSIRIPPG